MERMKAADGQVGRWAVRVGGGRKPPPIVEVGKSLILRKCVKMTRSYLGCFSSTSTSTAIRRSGRSERFTSTHFYSLLRFLVEADLIDIYIFIYKKTSLLPLLPGGGFL